MNEKELKEFYARFADPYSSGKSIGESLKSACMVDGKKVCEVKFIDGAYFSLKGTEASRLLKTYDGFKKICADGNLEIAAIESSKEEQVNLEPGA